MTLKEAVNKANEIFDLPEGIIAVNSKLVSRYVKDGILPAPEGRAKGYLYSEDFPYHIVTVLVLKRQYSRLETIKNMRLQGVEEYYSMLAYLQFQGGGV